MNQRNKVVVVGMFAALLGACSGASGPQVVRTRAVNEFSCPAEKVTVEELGGTSYRAKGCGQTATYTCMGGNVGNPYDAICTKEGTTTTTAAPAPK
jgi:hypothetical protein